MSNIFEQEISSLRQQERGQMTIIMVMVLPVIFLLFALALDAGVWFLDHRLAQNQADAAVLAAVQLLPSEDPGSGRPPTVAVREWLKKNGSSFGDLKECPVSDPPADLIPRPGLEYSDRLPAAFPDGKYDTIRVCVRRPSAAFFSQLAGIKALYVSASATAMVGPAGSSNVLPWGIVPPDPGCGDSAFPCANQLGENCGYFPPVPYGEDLCPWGLDTNRLYGFKISDPDSYTPGNFGALASCGTGTSDYRKCIEGEVNSGFFPEGQYVAVGAQTGVGGANTNAALNNRYEYEEVIGTKPGGIPILECDIESTPDPETALDPDGKAQVWTKIVGDPICERRLVALPVIESFPSSGSSENIYVLGIATFAIAGWDRNGTPEWGDPLANTTDACGEPSLNEGHACGMVWGYLVEGVRPPHFLFQNISEGSNPFVGNMTALVE